MVFTIPAVNYTTNDVYCVLNVAGMKDASGLAIQSHGNIGTGVTGAANGVLSNAVAATRGTVNLMFNAAPVRNVGYLW
jgi:hypothetical protein